MESLQCSRSCTLLPCVVHALVPPSAAAAVLDARLVCVTHLSSSTLLENQGPRQGKGQSPWFVSVAVAVRLRLSLYDTALCIDLLGRALEGLGTCIPRYILYMHVSRYAMDDDYAAGRGSCHACLFVLPCCQVSITQMRWQRAWCR